MLAYQVLLQRLILSSVTLMPGLNLLVSQPLHHLQSSTSIVDNIILVLVEGSTLHAGRLDYNELSFGLGYLLCNVRWCLDRGQIVVQPFVWDR